MRAPETNLWLTVAQLDEHRMNTSVIPQLVTGAPEGVGSEEG
jgi:hypothetical protein